MSELSTIETDFTSSHSGVKIGLFALSPLRIPTSRSVGHLKLHKTSHFANAVTARGVLLLQQLLLLLASGVLRTQRRAL